MEQIFLLTDKNYEEIELCRPLLDRVVNEACHGEFTTDDLKDMLQRGTAWGAYVVSDGKAKIVWMWEMVFFPKKTTVNVMALAGENLAKAWQDYGQTMCQLWKAQGAESVTCYSNRAMSKLLGRCGFKPIYYTLEKNL